MSLDHELPRYRCHKQVWALKIAAIEMLQDGRAVIAPSEHDYDTFTTDGLFPFKGSEADLGYYIQYADGYISWSPTKAFKDGYTLIKKA